MEVLKCGIIRSEDLFRLMESRPGDVLEREPSVLEEMIAESVRIKCEVVSADEKEGGLRRILNFGHTIGHALEAETEYSRFLHGEAVALGMKAAAHLSQLCGLLAEDVRDRILGAIELYGPFPSTAGIRAERLVARVAKDKKTVQGAVHYVLVEGIGKTRVMSGIDPALALEAARKALG
jgi:3-dehydroquinate synthase